MNTLRIATRASKLARWQAEHIGQKLGALGWAVDFVFCKTTGDAVLDRPLAAVGGKGLFVKEVEEALLAGRADVAVHSLKDVPTDTSPGLTLAAFPKRETPWDALLLHPALPRHPKLDASGQKQLLQLPPAARVGTSSLRRACQLLAVRPDLQIVPLRGNVDTRLSKLLAGELDAAVLAVAGLVRLGLAQHITQVFSPEVLMPAVGQGALAVQCRQAAPDVLSLLGQIDDFATRQAVLAERHLSERLMGNCYSALGAHATITTEGFSKPCLTLTAMVGSPDGTTILRASASGEVQKPAELAAVVAASLTDQGAGPLLAGCGPVGESNAAR